jgi:dTDP-glucose 4,6-dehydratase
MVTEASGNQLPEHAHTVVTGGAGFIGSAFARNYLADHPTARVTVIDKLTYAGNLANLAPIWENPRFRFVQADIADSDAIMPVVASAQAVVNFAAESHVDRSLTDPDIFVRTNVLGTNILLRAAKDAGVSRFVHVSTDEVYGHVATGAATEETPPKPRNPYSASKAGAELLAFSYFTNFGLPVIVTRGSNTIGPYQYPEKATPLFITNAIDHLPLPVYGQGTAIRDYLFVDDHAAAIDLILHRGVAGEAYNVGSEDALNTIELANEILTRLDRPASLVQFVADRPGHDLRYSLDSTKLRALGWRRTYDRKATLDATVEWYVANEGWWRPIKSGAFREYYRRQYGEAFAATAAAGRVS